jgi:mannose-6-phosphate isomerase-like protein (cupin superfamily)
MTRVLDGPGGAAVIRATEAETMENESVSLRLLLDASATHAAASALSVSLRDGADGATPHCHHHSSELFYILDGSVELLAGDTVLQATRGDLVVVPPELPHAFAATHGRHGQLLIVITPGVERFEYFRHLARIAQGHAAPESLRDVQDLYDTHFLPSPAWLQARQARPTPPSTMP